MRHPLLVRLQATLRDNDISLLRSTHSSASVTLETSSSSTTAASESVIPFHEIPGPKGLPIIGNLWRYLPVVGEYDMERLDEIGRLNYKRYGPIVRENVFGKFNIVHLFDPNDMQSLFRAEGRWPERRSHRALGQYRRERPEQYSSGGIFCENGQEWYRLRKISQVSLMNPNNVNSYIGVTTEVTDQLVDLIRCERDAMNEMHDFEYDLYKWSLENITQVVMDTRFGCLSPKLDKNSEARKVIRAAHEVIESIHKTEIGQSDLWRFIPTKTYRQLCRGEDVMAQIVSKYLKIKLQSMQKDMQVEEQDKNISSSLRKSAAVSSAASSSSQVSSSMLSSSQNNPNDTILGQFFKTNSDASFGDILSTVLDLMLAGIDTTAFSAGFIVYYLARNPDKQDKLRQEIRKFLPSLSDPITPDIISKMPFMRACVREGMRLTPLSVGIGRVTTAEETIIRNYSIPKGTMVITHNQVASRLPQNFDRPDDFIPERWLFDRKNDGKMMSTEETKGVKVKKPHPFVSLPFGFGPRSCPGRRLSDMNTYVLLIQLLRNFHVEYHYEDIGVVTRLINIPDKAMQFRFNDIDY